MIPESARHTDRMSGVVAEVGTDGVPLGLAVPEQLLDRSPSEVSRAVLRALTAAAGDARELLERRAEEEWDGAGRERSGAGWERSGVDDDMASGFVR